MARPLDKNAVKERIKENKTIMKATKKTLTGFMGNNPDNTTAQDARRSLALFIKASNAVTQDNAKLST